MATPSLLFLKGDPATWPAIPAGKTGIGANAAGQIAVKQDDGSVSILGAGTTPTFNAQTSNTGTVTITPGAPIHTEVVTLTGAARTAPLNVATAGRTAGNRLSLLVKIPASAGFTLQLNNDAAQIDTFGPSDGLIVTGVWELYFDGTAWNILSALFPAFV